MAAGVRISSFPSDIIPASRIIRLRTTTPFDSAAHNRYTVTMPKIEQTITVASPAEAVFAVISAVEHSPAWISALKSIRDYQGSPSVGATFTEVASFMGKTMETGKEIVV